MKTITYNPETHALVPREPSEEMCDAATADSCWENMNPPPSTAYRLMLAAAPQPEQVESEPVYQVCMTDSVSLSGAWIDVDKQTYHDAGLYKEYKLRALYTTPQPDRTAELEAALKVARDAIDDLRNGLKWYQDAYPDSISEADHEEIAKVDAAIDKINEVLK